MSKRIDRKYSAHPLFFCCFSQLLSISADRTSNNSFYIRSMIRKILLILFMVCLFLPYETVTATNEDTPVFLPADVATQGNTLEPASTNEGEETGFDKLSQYHPADFCIATTRTQLLQAGCERPVKIISKLFELLLQKEQNQQNKTSEILRSEYSIKLSSLRTHAGHWIYVLRKIII